MGRGRGAHRPFPFTFLRLGRRYFTCVTSGKYITSIILPCKGLQSSIILRYLTTCYTCEDCKHDCRLKNILFLFQFSEFSFISKTTYPTYIQSCDCPNVYKIENSMKYIFKNSIKNILHIRKWNRFIIKLFESSYS